MSSPDLPRDDAVCPDPVGTDGAPAAPTVRTAEATTPVIALPEVLPPDSHVLLEMIGRGLSPEADDGTRSAAHELWTRLAASLVTALPMSANTPGVAMLPGTQPMPSDLATPSMPTIALPTSPIAMVARTLKQLTPEQLIDLVLQRLRAALPAGAPVAAPRGIQFPLVPVPPYGGR